MVFAVGVDLKLFFFVDCVFHWDPRERVDKHGAQALDTGTAAGEPGAGVERVRDAEFTRPVYVLFHAVRAAVHIYKVSWSLLNDCIRRLE